jgi:hypothetical protein
VRGLSVAGNRCCDTWRLALSGSAYFADPLQVTGRRSSLVHMAPMRTQAAITEMGPFARLLIFRLTLALLLQFSKELLNVRSQPGLIAGGCDPDKAKVYALGVDKLQGGITWASTTND